ncbi:MAG TPA: ankyrin repeat domain-containing protein [Vicinamibacterales bacterium]|nr:ankyrin repeat domain-containing protein [Vicinamibacterales bacterium]
MGRILKACGASFVGAAMVVAIASAAGDSPLTRAVRAGDVQAVRTLVKSGVDVNARSGDGSTPLLWAASNSAHEIANILIAAKATVDTPNDFGITPLLHASRIGDAAMVDLLLKAGASPSRAHPEGETPLMAAARSGSVPAVRALLARGANVNAAETIQNTTALMWASAEGHLDVADVLIEAGADVNRQAHVTTLTERHNSDHPSGGFTALMFAARSGDEAMVKRLVARGANVNLKNGDGASALMVAMYNDWFDLAKTLIELGTDANEGALYLAVEMRDGTTDQFAFDGSRRRPNHTNRTTALDLMRFLLERGADPNKTFTGQLHSTSMPNTDRFDNTPFFRAAIAADVEALKLLIAHGASLEQSPAVVKAASKEKEGDQPAEGRGRGNPNAGRTAAMVVMTGGRGPAMTGGPAYIRDGPAPYREPGSRKPEDAFALLLASGANPNAKGPDGAPLLHQVVRLRNLEMIRALANAKVDFNQKNTEGFTALDVAEGKQPAPQGRAGGPPPGGGGRGRGRGASQQDVAKLLRELMGLPPAPASTPAEGAQ